MNRVDMNPDAVEARLAAASEQSPLTLEFARMPRVEMSPAAVEARLCEWAELTIACLELGELGRTPKLR